MQSPTCVNCKQVGHIGSWRGCPLFPKPGGNFRNEQQARNSFPAQRNLTQPSVSYARVADNTNYQHQVAPQYRPYDSSAKTTVQSEVHGLPSDFKDSINALKELKALFDDIPVLLAAIKLMRTVSEPLDKIAILIEALQGSSAQPR